MTRKPIVATTLGTASFLLFAGAVHAAEIRILSTQATEQAYRELVPQFEKASGHKVTTVFTGTHVPPVDRGAHQGRQGGGR